MSAIEIALMDIKGKVLGGKFRDDLRCYASQLQFGWTSEIGRWGKKEEYVDIVQHAISEGYDAVKIDFTMYGRNKELIAHERKEGLFDGEFPGIVEERMEAIRDGLRKYRYHR